MEYSKQTMIESLKHSIEQANVKIKELSEPCVKSLAHSRSAERDFWKKKLKDHEMKLKELEDDKDSIEKSLL